MATSVKRPGALSSLSKNSRRHGAGNEARSMAWTESRSPLVAGRITSSPTTAPLLKLHLRLGQTDVDRCGVGVAGELPVRRDLHGATRAGRGDIRALEK